MTERVSKHFVCVFLVPLTMFCGLLLFASSASAQFPAEMNPLVRRGDTQQVAGHTHIILDENATFVPNVGIVVGERATLIIDTGLGERNGRIILREARGLSGNDKFVVAATHYHPEHDLGAEAFPDNAILVRWSEQQREIDRFGLETIERFSSFAPVVAELLEGVQYRDADVIFPDEVTLDLGGVHVRVIGVGPNHTIGDTVFFVEEDKVLFAGDVVMPVFPAASAQFGNVDKWIANMDAFEALGPAVVVPAHGALGNVDSIRVYRDYLTAVRDRATGLASSRADVDSVIAAVATEIAAEFAVLHPATGSPTGRIASAIRMALRE